VSGKANPYAPQWTYNIGVEYAFNVSAGATLTPRLNYSYLGEQWTTLIEAPATDLLPAYGLLNASLTYRNSDWRLEAYALNLADKHYVTGQAGNNQFYGAPRQAGVRVSRSF
jgi:iron complex outermembrane receptor protein